jgi:hypothetical protein
MLEARGSVCCLAVIKELAFKKNTASQAFKV